MTLFYTKLAKYYDKIYHYIPYKKQVNFFIKLIKSYNKSNNNKILDVACGTGIHADLLERKGFKVVGVDISKEMLKQAERKNSKIRFIQGDMKKIRLNERFGTIICFFNSILYNNNKKKMKQALSNLYSHLERKGILIFDVIDKSMKIKKEEYMYKDSNLKISFKPEWKYNQKNNVIDLDIEFIINNKKLHDHHVLGAFSIEELKQILEEIGFEVFIFERNFETLKRFSGGKAVFVCVK